MQVGNSPALEVRRGAWTPWLRMTFQAGLTRIHGMVKLLLLEVQPQFKLLVTPIHVIRRPAFAILSGRYARSPMGAFHTLGMPRWCTLSHRR
jgi:hypothetical protein